jgi:TPR repeat protein
MKCIVCKFCETNLEVLDKKLVAWFDTQTNNVAIMEREADPAAIHHAYDLLKTDPAESFRQFLALAEGGSVWSMASVGNRFEHGLGIAPDLAQAENWYLRAYQAGSDYALIWLGDLYQKSKRYEQAQAVFRTGVERGFVPAMFRLAWSYWNSPDWPQRRDEAMALLERSAAAGDLSAKRFLAVAMMRGGFGLRHIPNGIRLLLSVAEEMADLGKDETATAPSDSKTRKGIFGGLAARLWLLGAARHPAS